jgi:uncharacterized protein YndB with AHSA1/START domain
VKDGFTRVFSVAVPPERLWRAFTEKSEMEAWFAPVMGAVDVRVGGHIFCGEKGPDEVECEVLEVEEPHRLRWVERGPSLPAPIDITVVLDRVVGATRVSFTESKYGNEPDWSWRDEMIEVERAVTDLRRHLSV